MNPSAQLDALVRELGAFIGLLEQEAEVLAANRTDALSPLIAQRDGMNQRLASLWKSLTQSLGMPATANLTTLRECCQRSAAESWRQVEEMTRHAEKMNRLNSRLIDEQLSRTQLAIQILRNAAGSRTLYGANGRVSELHNPNRSIDSA